MKADKKGKNKPEIVRPADIECKTCDGNIRGLFTKTKESEEVEAEISEGPRKTKELLCGIKLSLKEIEERDRTHIPCRSWCKHCVF